MPGNNAYQILEREKKIEERKNESDRLWQAYAKDRSSDHRNDLLMHYVDLVKRVVNRLFAGSGSYHEYDDLISYGVIGLMDAIDRFEPRPDARFESYAQIRIKGEVIDYMRRQDWLPVSLRSRLRQVQTTYEKLAQELGREPHDQEVADKLGLSLENLHHIHGQAHLANIIYFDDLISESGTRNQIESSDTRLEIAYEVDEMREHLISELKNLTEREQMVLSLYYTDELTLKEIGLVLDLTESRISQIHSKALLHLKSRLKRTM